MESSASVAKLISHLMFFPGASKKLAPFYDGLQFESS